MRPGEGGGGYCVAISERFDGRVKTIDAECFADIFVLRVHKKSDFNQNCYMGIFWPDFVTLFLFLYNFNLRIQIRKNYKNSDFSINWFNNGYHGIK